MIILLNNKQFRESLYWPYLTIYLSVCSPQYPIILLATSLLTNTKVLKCGGILKLSNIIPLNMSVSSRDINYVKEGNNEIK